MNKLMDKLIVRLINKLINKLIQKPEVTEMRRELTQEEHLEIKKII